MVTPDRAVSRRTFLRSAGLTVSGGSVVFLAACGRGSSPKPAVGGSDAADIAILGNALDLEQTAIAAYTAGMPLLAEGMQKTAKQVLLQEFAHAGELATLIKHAGGKPSLPAPSYKLGHPRRPAEVLALLDMVERSSITAYVDAVPKVSSRAARAKLASILANEAQHIALVRQALGRTPAPEALVSGRA